MEARALPPVWVANGRAADEVINEILGTPTAGYDTEFYGCDITEESPVGKAIVDVLSIAIPTERVSPLGFKLVRSWVFDGKCLTESESLRNYLENPEYTKVAHNLAVDSHATRNAGVRLRGAQDSLNLARWVYPDRANLPKGNYDLDSLSKWRVGFGKSEDFDAFLGYYVDEPYQEMATKRRCSGCLELGCRKKKPPHDLKVDEEVEVTRTKKVRKHVFLPDIRPDGPRRDIFERYVAYAATDAELALILWQMMQIDGQVQREYPYETAGF